MATTCEGFGSGFCCCNDFPTVELSMGGSAWAGGCELACPFLSAKEASKKFPVLAAVSVEIIPSWVVAHWGFRKSQTHFWCFQKQ